MYFTELIRQYQIMFKLRLY